MLQLKLIHNGALMSCCCESEWFCIFFSYPPHNVQNGIPTESAILHCKKDRAAHLLCLKETRCHDCKCYRWMWWQQQQQQQTLTYYSFSGEHYTCIRMGPTKTVAYILYASQSRGKKNCPTVAFKCPSCGVGSQLKLLKAVKYSSWCIGFHILWRCVFVTFCHLKYSL